ncbi:MAG: hypothetical protein K0A93_04415 [Desulfuromonadaceae bacterium]|nr:hypothetical protein [Desulfuromonadaceae bacterium]
MRWMLIALLSSALLLSGCAEKFYKVSKDEYRVRVQTLGVLPLLIDTDSLKIYPEAGELAKVLMKNNLGKEARLVEMLRKVKGYFDIREIVGDPAALYQRLVTRGAMNDREPFFRSYRFDPLVVRELADRNGVDGLLIIIVNGVTRGEKRWDRTNLSYLHADFDMLLATAAVATVSGDVLWEFPGYATEPFLPLQYPNFDKAYYNLATRVDIEDISVDGINRLLTEPDRVIFGGTNYSRRYRELFDRLTSALKPGGQLQSLPVAPATAQ